MRSLRATGRMRASVRQAEQDGLVFAFRARALAIAVVSLWMIALVPWPRDAYYLLFAGAFFLLGYVPYRLRRHPRAELIKLSFVVLDVALLTAAILTPPPAGLGTDWPIQTRMRGQEYLYVVLLLGEAALTYSPLRVLWTGLSILLIWSAGFFVLYGLPDTTRAADVMRSGIRFTDAEALRMVFQPTYVGFTQWSTQLVATSLLTCLLALAVLRSRRHLLAQVKAEVVRSDLARYVSPDVADALTARAPTGFGEPATRRVPVLFADIVGFTALTERLPPERTFELLRSFQERSCRIVFQHGGTLDKYLGDGLMATFGGLEEQPDAAARAVACAFALRDEIARWSRKRVGRGALPIRVAVGVHCGSVVVGNLGAEQRIEFTVVGDVVNVASRLEEANRELGSALVVSAACLDAIGGSRPRFDRTAEVQLRGRRGSLVVHIADGT